MEKHTTKYASPLDALIVLAKRLNAHEERHGLTSEEFFNKFRNGSTEDSVEFVEWSNDYQHFLSLKIGLEKQLTHVA